MHGRHTSVHRGDTGVRRLRVSRSWGPRVRARRLGRKGMARGCRVAGLGRLGGLVAVYRIGDIIGALVHGSGGRAGRARGGSTRWTRREGEGACGARAAGVGGTGARGMGEVGWETGWEGPSWEGSGREGAGREAGR